MEIQIPYVLSRGKGYRYRRIVPPDVRKTIGRKNWTKSFKSEIPLIVVEREARRLAAKHGNEIASARGQEVTPEQIAMAESQAREWLTESDAKRYEMLDFLHSSGVEDLPPESNTNGKNF